MESIKRKRVKPSLRLLAKGVPFAVGGWYGMNHFKNMIGFDVLGRGVMMFVLMACFAIVFTYGVIYLIRDFREGGIAYIINKIIGRDG